MMEDWMVIPLVIVMFVAGLFVGAGIGTSAQKKQAVTAGYAEYIADENGSSQWQWKVQKGENDAN